MISTEIITCPPDRNLSDSERTGVEGGAEGSAVDLSTGNHAVRRVLLLNETQEDLSNKCSLLRETPIIPTTGTVIAKVAAAIIE
jgi:hypothetical protein